MRLWTSGHRDEEETRGGGAAGRVDAFRVRLPGTVLAAVTLAALGLFALAAAVFDLGNARQTGDAFWLAPAGIVLLVTAAGFGWFAVRRPVVLTVGPDGLFQPVAWKAPIPWRDIWRMRYTYQRHWLRANTALLQVDLPPGAMVPYKRWARSVPSLDRWMVRNFGVRIPLQHVDADPETVLASIERFRPVAR